MKPFQRGFSLSIKLTALYSLLILLVSSALTFALFWQFRQAQEQALRARLLDIVRFAEPLIQGDIHQSIRIPEDIGSANYQAIFVRLKSIQDTSDVVKGVYTLRQDENGNWFFIVDLPPEGGNVSRAGKPYYNPPDLLNQNLSDIREPQIETRLVGGASGYTLSGFIPFRNRFGQPEGLLGVDIDANAIIAAQNRALQAAVLAFLATVPLSLWLGTVLARRLVSPVRDLTAGAKRVAQGILNQAVPVRSRDELGLLAQSFNQMQADLQQSRLELEEYAHTLEEKVAERTEALQEMNVALSMRAVQLQISSQVAQQVNAILDLDELLTQVIKVLQARFGFYYAGVWLHNEKTQTLTLRSGKPGMGFNLPASGFQIPLAGDYLMNRVCQHMQARIVDDFTAQGDCQPLRVYFPLVRGEIAIPLRVGERLLGILDIQSDEGGPFDGDDLNLLKTLADQVAIAIRNAQLYETEQKRRRLAESLERTFREVTSSLDLREVPGRILETLQDVVPFERGSVMLQQENELVVIAQRGFPDDERAQNLRINLRDGDVYQQMVEAYRPIWVDDVTQSAGWQQVEWLPLNRSWLGVPLINKDRVIGMISLTRPEAGAFTAEDGSLVLAFAGQAAVALENASLYDDITRFSEQLEKAYHNLERLDKAKSDFIEVAAHELRTPLTVIKGYIQVIGTRPGVVNDTDTKTLLTSVLDGVQRLHEIINSMLDVSKIDNQTLQMHIAPTWLNMVLRRVQTDFKTVLLERNLSLNIADLTNLPWIQADADLLYKVFYHVIINAIKYTPDGGVITISGRSVLDALNRPAVEIVVADTGIGIDPDYHELIFEKFYQTGQVAVHSSGRTKFKGGGPGLGLAIAKGIVKAHGGRIWVESLGHDESKCPGSKFFIQLPIKQPAPAEPSTSENNAVGSRLGSTT
ncbi:MAG: hypothetical protein OHK0052_06630 [Anaerolineales bacterium]